jgi:hypothetical protein
MNLWGCVRSEEFMQHKVSTQHLLRMLWSTELSSQVVNTFVLITKLFTGHQKEVFKN